MAGELPTDWWKTVQSAAVATHAKAETVASRKASQLALEVFTAALPELLGGSADLTGSNLTNTKHTPALRFDADGSPQARRERPRRPAHQLRRARVRHGRGDERRRPARRLHPLRRHLPHLQRLQPQRDPDGGADEAARDPRLHPRLDRPRRGRADAPVGRARGVAAADSRTSTSGAPATRSRRWRPGPRRSAGATARRRCCCRARTCPMRPSRRSIRPGPTARSARSPRAPTCSPSRPRSACAASRRRC